ncbi:hypothetical protein RSK60_1300020 [Ralstonia solanacearum K60]|nr:hypothetical protein RSK60_1300020 [Ralstonia solanacearum K60]
MRVARHSTAGPLSAQHPHMLAASRLHPPCDTTGFPHKHCTRRPGRPAGPAADPDRGQRIRA